MNVLTIAIDYMGTWHIHLFFGTAICALLLLEGYRKRIGWAATLLWIYAVISALYLVEFPDLPFGNYTRAFRATAGESLAELLLIPTAILTFRWRIWNLIPWLTGWTIACIWMGWNGPLMAASFNAALVALCIPFVPHWMKALGIATILSRHAGTAQLILCTQLLALAVHDRRIRRLLIPGTVLLGCLVYIYRQGDVLAGQGRLGIWTRTLTVWAENWRTIIFGMGPGSFMWVSLMVDKFQIPAFFHMHSDVLQVLFELGLIGLSLALCTLYRAVRNVWDSPRLLAAVFGAVAFCATYHPFRFFCSAFVMGLIFKECLGTKKARTFQCEPPLN